MYTDPRPTSIDMRDVIAAWLVCLALAAALFLYPELASKPESEAQAAPDPQTALCALRKSTGKPHG